MGDDAPAAAPTKLLQSPLTDADGRLVPCSCKIAAVCAKAGGHTASSCVWYLASTSAPAKLAFRAPDGRIKYKEKKPGSTLHARMIQRTIVPGEQLMCSSCYQQKNTAQKVHHAVAALATA